MLYIPKQTLPDWKGASRKNQRWSRGRLLSLSAVLLLLAIMAALALWQAEHHKKSPADVKRFMQDIEYGWSWSDAQLATGSSGAEWTIRWDIASAKLGTMKQLVDKIFYDNQKNPVDKLIRNEGRSVSADLAGIGGNVSIHLVNDSEESESVMVLFETKRDQMLDKNALMQVVESISRDVAAANPDFTGSFKVHGFTDNSDIMNDLRKQMQAKLVEQYDELGTVSKLFYTNRLRASIAAGNGERANVQIAVHQSTESKLAELTIGVPVITGDYSSTAP